ncbi:MAG: UDP-N-acetylmuramate dehydrogenase [Bacillota bacterium]|jgi:UDP-N-acetylmuramate dehydrogenase
MSKIPLQDKLQSLVKEPILVDEPMHKHTTWRIGGPADFMVFPSSEQEIINVLNFLHEQAIPCLVIGNGSNILVGDKGIRGVVMKMGPSYAASYWQGCQVEAQAGMMLRTLSLEAAERSCGGIEFAAGIPGSIGGAVRMNAGAYGNTIGEYVTKVAVIEYNGNRYEITADNLNFAYRYSSLFAVPAVVSTVHLAFPLGNKDESMAKIKEWLQLRSLKQPLEFPSCGSVFRNPPHDHAGRLIEMAGLRGKQIGGAMVSKKHGNFIINIGGARAKDVKALIEEVQQEVFRLSGVRLETEVKLVGEFVPAK